MYLIFVHINVISNFHSSCKLKAYINADLNFRFEYCYIVVELKLEERRQQEEVVCHQRSSRLDLG